MLTELAIQHDDFTDKKTLEFIKVGNDATRFIKLYPKNSGTPYGYLGFTFVNHDGFIYIEFQSNLLGSFPVSKGDSIIMLFEGGVRIEYVFIGKSSGDRYTKTNHCALTIDHLQIFANSNFLKLKITNLSKSVYAVMDLNGFTGDSSFMEQVQYKDEFTGRAIIQEMAAKFINAHIILPGVSMSLQ